MVELHRNLSCTYDAEKLDTWSECFACQNVPVEKRKTCQISGQLLCCTVLHICVVQCGAVRCTMRCCAVRCAVLCGAVRCGAVMCCTAMLWCCTVSFIVSCYVGLVVLALQGSSFLKHDLPPNVTHALYSSYLCFCYWWGRLTWKKANIDCQLIIQFEKNKMEF